MGAQARLRQYLRAHVGQCLRQVPRQTERKRRTVRAGWKRREAWEEGHTAGDG
jgi:hypothetical protein